MVYVAHSKNKPKLHCCVEAMKVLSITVLVKRYFGNGSFNYQFY